MPQWTKKAAIERMESNQKLQQVYVCHPLARLLVESAANLKRHQGYHRIASHYAYKDWMWAAAGHENADYWTCIHVIDDLLPPDNGDTGQGSSVYTDNPQLPCLPDRPEKALHPKSKERKFALLSIQDLRELASLEKQRHSGMRAQLEQVYALISSQWLLSPDEEMVLSTFDHQGYKLLSESIEQSGLSRKDFFQHVESLVKKKYIRANNDLLVFRRSDKPYQYQHVLISEGQDNGKHN